MATRAPLSKWLGLAALGLLLSGCVNYQVGFVLGWDGRGVIEQILQLDPLVVSLARPQLVTFNRDLQQRVAQVGGTLTTETTGLKVTIPFQSPQEIESKFATFFQSNQPKTATTPSWLTATTQSFRVEETNFWVARALSRLPIAYGQRSFQLAADNLLTMQLRVVLPLPPLKSNATQQQGQTLLWDIKLNQLNPLEISFLLPNLPLLGFLGLGGLGGVGWWYWGRIRNFS
jgi:hypothetical protein